MKIIISNSSYIPIFEQIKNAIIENIMNNELESEELLPSIRSLASDLKVSVLTVKKAYDELESEGYIITRQGKGSYVAFKNDSLVKEEKQKEIENYISKIIDIANIYDIDKKDIIDLFIYMCGEK